MPDSMFDFGNIAQFAQNNLRNAQQMYQMDQQERQLGLRDRELDIRAAQEQNSAINAQTARLNSIKSYLDHPLVQNTPALQDKLFETVAPELGIPVEGLGDKLTQSRADRMALLEATLGKDEEKATKAVIKLMAGMGNDDAAKFLKNIESVPTLYEKAQHAYQVMQVNGEEFAKMRQGQANINEGLQDITALSSQMRREVAVLDTKEYKNAQKFYNTLNRASILDPADKTLPKQEKLALSSLFPENAKAKADGIAEQMKSVKYQLDTATHALDDIELHGAPQAGNMKEKLTARVAALTPIYGTLSAMHDFYKDPLNSQNAANAKMAYEHIEAKRTELVSLEKKIDSHRQRLVGKVNEKFEYDQAQDSAIAEAQRRFLALPESQRTASSAGRISQALQRELGVDVLPEKIYKDPNNPTSQVTINNALGKAETKYAEEFNQNLAKGDFSLYQQATKAPELHDRSSRIIDVLTNQKTITGSGAEWRLAVAKALKLAGLYENDDVENTEALFADLAQNTLDQVKESGLGSGTGFSNTDRDYLEKAKGGRITLDKDSLLKIAKINQRVQELTVDRWNKRVKQLPDSALQPGGITRDPMTIPKFQSSPQPGKAHPQSEKAPMSIKSDDEFNKLPSGTIFIGPDGKKRKKP